MSYNRDLQELTPALWRGVRDAKQSTSLLAGMLATATFDPVRMEEEAGKGLSTATDLADMLVRTYDLPFRTAHSIVGRAARNGSLALSALDDAAVEITGSSLSKRGLTDEEIRVALDVRKSLDQKKATGSPAPAIVRAAIEERRTRLAADREAQERVAESVRESIGALIRDARRISREQ
jgi:argininosuccinate lyase